MNVTKATVKKLISNGYTEEDIFFFEDNTKNVKCFLCNDDDDEKEEKITHKQAKELIGEYHFVSAVIRALHHTSAVRDIENTKDFIYFEKKS